MVHDTSRLDPLVADYAVTAQAATDLCDNYISLKRRGKKIKVKQVCSRSVALSAHFWVATGGGSGVGRASGGIQRRVLSFA